MKRLLFRLGLAVVVICIGCFRCLASDPLPSLDSVLAKWEAASQKCKTLDAKLTVWRYDRVFGGDKPEIAQGRFYYEAPNIGRYELRKSGSASSPTNDWSNLSQVIIWTGKETLWIDGTRRDCQKFSSKELKTALGNGPIVSPLPLHQESGLTGFFQELFRRVAYPLQGPQQIVPLVVGVRAADVRERFDVTIARSGKQILLKAVPKQALEKAEFREVDVLLNATTYFTDAVQMVTPSGNDRQVVAMDDPKLNVKPSDREELLAPKLPFGFTVRETIGPALLPAQDSAPSKRHVSGSLW